jgi:hypothetical protein
LNPGRRGGKPATNRLSYGAAYRVPSIAYLFIYSCLFALFLVSSVYPNLRMEFFVFAPIFPLDLPFIHQNFHSLAITPNSGALAS